MTGSNAETVTNIKAELHRDAQAISERGKHMRPLRIICHDASQATDKKHRTTPAASNLLIARRIQRQFRYCELAYIVSIVANPQGVSFGRKR